MRNGDFGLETIAARGDDIRETDSGHVLARPGTVYSIRLRNFGPLRCVANVRLDGKPITAGGLVLEAFSVVTLERPVDGAEHGRFTVIPEGNERVFGPDGGRDNPDLGVIEARFRRELPHTSRRDDPRPLPDFPSLPMPQRPMAPPGWTPPGWESAPRTSRPDVSAILPSRAQEQPTRAVPTDLVERAAGTGLTGHSAQEFTTAFVGPLETEATVLKLRLVIGTDEAFVAPKPAQRDADAPERPVARP
jgi:hypothetical protein